MGDHDITVFANPFLHCLWCLQPVSGWHDGEACCEGPMWNDPCGHQSAVISTCPSWGPVDGCTCPTPSVKQMSHHIALVHGEAQ